MKKIAKFLLSIALILVLLILGATLAEKKLLQDSIVRLHVRANSNSVADQEEKLAVRDALQQYLCGCGNMPKTAEDAKIYLQKSLPELKACANELLSARNSNNRARISLRKEAFPTRSYDDFSLPAGVYDALVVEIGDAEGENWWCVVFPSLCLQDFSAAAAAVGMDSDIQNTLKRCDRYEIRFFFLECLGKIENLFHKS